MTDRWTSLHGVRTERHSPFRGTTGVPPLLPASDISHNAVHQTVPERSQGRHRARLTRPAAIVSAGITLDTQPIQTSLDAGCVLGVAVTPPESLG
jgi:hypothetical protein